MKKLIFLPFLCLILSLPLSAQSVTDSLMTEAHKLVEEKQEAKALSIYKAVINLDTANAEALIQAGILTVREGRRQPSKAAKEKLFSEARSFAESALRKDPSSVKANVVLANALNELALVSGAKDKINLLHNAKDFIDKALLIDSGYAHAWHISGRWNMELTSLGFAEKTAARLLFGGMPDASLDKAIADFEKCRQLSPSFILNYYDLAKAYHLAGKDLKAIATLQQAIRLRPVLQDDLDIQQKCREMIEQLQ